jgi:hypothetical protein
MSTNKTRSMDDGNQRSASTDVKKQKEDAAEKSDEEVQKQEISKDFQREIQKLSRSEMSDSNDSDEDDNPRPKRASNDDEEPENVVKEKDGKKTNERPQSEAFKKASTDSQCMICGWPYKWAGWDKTHLGATLYEIEEIYVSLRNHSFSRLFSDYHTSHILHKHSKEVLRTLCVDMTQYNEKKLLFLNNLFVKNYNLIVKYPNDDESDLQELRIQETWMKRNTAVLIESVTLQVVYTFDSALATYTALAEDAEVIDASTRQTHTFACDWINKRLKALSSASKLKDVREYYKNLTHSACQDCNVAQTMLFEWETSILAVLGIRKAHVPPKTDPHERKITREVAGMISTAYITTAVLLKVGKRYEMSENHSQALVLFVQQLVLLNMQCVTTSLADAYAFDPPPKKRVGPERKATSLRHRFQAYAAFMACTVQYACMNMSICIASVLGDPNDAQMRVSLAMDIDQFWKYVVVECAEYDFTASVDEFHSKRQTVYQFYFGSESFMRFKVVNMLDQNHDQFHGLLVKCIDGITSKMISAHGIAMHMFALTDSAQLKKELFQKRLNRYPAGLCAIGKNFAEKEREMHPASTTCKGIYTNYGFGGNFLINPLYGREPEIQGVSVRNMSKCLHEDVVTLLQNMRPFLMSHTAALKNLEVITSSTMIERRATPGTWCKHMRSPTHKRAVEKLLRMPLLFNGMVGDDVQQKVYDSVRRLLSLSDPLMNAY